MPCSNFFIDVLSTQKTMQQMMVQYAFDHMGSDIFSVLERGKHTSLFAVLKSAKQEILPAISTSTTRRWIKHYLFFGETAQETKEYRNKVWGTSICKKRFTWTTDDISCLKNIIDDKPYLFLDEIQEKFHETTGKYYSTSTIWRLLSEHLNYSVKVAFERAIQSIQKIVMII